MGSGSSSQNIQKDCYLFRFHDIKASKHEIKRVKRAQLKKNESAPNLISSNTIFSPYVDVHIGSHGESGSVVQRKVAMEKKSTIGNGKLDYRYCDYFQFSPDLPWLLKNAYFSEPNLKDLEVTRTIGKGRSGTVRIAKTKNDKYMVVKTILKDYIFKKGEEKHTVNEREIFYEMNSPFCAKLFAEFEDRTAVYFAMEYVPGGELYRCLEMQNALEKDVAKFYLIEIFAALEHIHSIGYVYRDLKPENVAIDEQGHIKLVDFGSAVRQDCNPSGKLYTLCCELSYLSPEQMNGKHSGGYTKIVDWWAYGILAFEVMVGHTPYCGNKETQYEILLKILKNKIHFPSHFDPKAKRFICDLLHHDPKVRVTDPKHIKEHDYYDDVKHWGNVYDRHLVPPFVPELVRPGDSHYYILTEEKSAKHWQANDLEALVKMF